MSIRRSSYIPKLLAYQKTTLQASLVTSSSSRRNSSSASSSSLEPDYIHTLLQNEELSRDDAINELRWITQEVKATAQRMIAKGKMPAIEEDSISEMVQRRSRGEPIQYILGSTDFGPLTIQCRRPVLIPRPETAYLTEKLSSYILSLIPPLTSRDRPKQPLSILDLCSGTGCIGLLLGKLNPLSTVTGIDNSPVAVQLGMINSRDLKLSDRVKFKYGNLSKDPKLLLSSNAESKGKYGLIISNPPYIPFHEYQKLPKSVKDFESPSALLGDGLNEKQGKGLKYYERISEISPDLLIDKKVLEMNGWNSNIPRLALEIGQNQSKDVIEILESNPMIGKTEIWKDQFGVERMILAWSK
ncbi:uncharacterized protein L201_002804 [Kwoniella dendrophila CBS 6074]|uniref:Methyltransferase small domain-containing protein n=1 Tax=Kwoniella dendrophila CBS 6074 TaxID=1295534 RepID=A0AAX4JSP7_9TREE